jgi:hypothetical protein
VQARSEIDITKQGNIDRRILSMQTILERALHGRGLTCNGRGVRWRASSSGPTKEKEAASTTPADTRYTLCETCPEQVLLGGR